MAVNDSTRQDRQSDDVTPHTTPDDTGEHVGEGVGGVSGAIAGAAIGTVGGPLGVVIGGIAGAVGGWWAGREIGQTADGYTDEHDAEYHRRFDATPIERRGRFQTYAEARPLYQLGHLAASNPEYAGRSFEDVEPDLRHGWDRDIEARFGAWDAVRNTVRDAYVSRAGSRMTHSDMEVVRRPISADTALDDASHPVPGRAAASDRADLDRPATPDERDGR
jgi:hypothetical protein